MNEDLSSGTVNGGYFVFNEMGEIYQYFKTQEELIEYLDTALRIETSWVGYFQAKEVDVVYNAQLLHDRVHTARHN